MASEIALINAQMFRELDANQGEWLNRAQTYQRKRQGELYTDAQLAEIKALDLEPAGINLYAPIINTMASSIHSDQSGMAVLPLGETDREMAYLMQAVIDNVLQKARWEARRYQILQDQFSVGIGVAHVDRADNPFGTTVKYCPFYRLRYPQSNGDLFWDDLEQLVYYDIMSMKQAIRMTGAKFKNDMLSMEAILRCQDDYNTFFQNERVPLKQADKKENQDVLYLESYTKEYEHYQELTFWNADNSKVERTEMAPMYSPDELKRQSWHDIIDDGFRNAYTYFYQGSGGNKKYATSMVKQLKNGQGEMTPLKLKRVIKNVSVGGCDIGRYVLPTSRVPFVPYHDELIGYPEGEIRYIDPVNRAINQTLHLLTYNGRVMSNPIVFAFANTIDPVQYAKARSVPFGLVTVNAQDLSDPQKSMPKIEYPQSIGPHFSEMMTRLQNVAEYSTGIYGAFQGNPGQALETHSTTTELNNLAYQRLVPKAKQNQFSTAIVGELIKDFVIAFSDRDILMRYKENNDELFNTFSGDQPGEGVVGMRIQGQDHYNMVIPINKTVYDSNDKMTLVNNLQNTRNEYEVVIRSAPSTHTVRERWAADIRLFIQQSASPELAAVALKWLGKLNEMPFIQQMTKEMDMVAQLKADNETMKEAIEKLKDDLLNSEKKQVTAKISERSAAIHQEEKSKLEKISNKFELLYEKAKLGMEATGTEAKAKVDQELMQLLDELESDLKSGAQEAASEVGTAPAAPAPPQTVLPQEQNV